VTKASARDIPKIATMFYCRSWFFMELLLSDQRENGISKGVRKPIKDHLFYSNPAKGRLNTKKNYHCIIKKGPMWKKSVIMVVEWRTIWLEWLLKCLHSTKRLHSCAILLFVLGDVVNDVKDVSVLY
jgi:hypothetical protein